MRPGTDLPAGAAESLLAGERDAPQLERFLERAERDPAASAELDFLADLAAAAELERPLLETALASSPPRKRHGRAIAWLAAAAALFVACWLVLGRDREPPARELAERSIPRYIAADLRAEDAPLARDFARAMEPYVRGDFAAAADALGTLLEASPDHQAARFYLAAAREALGELETAEELYRAVAAQGEDYLAEHAAWRLASLLLRRDDVPAARAELERLAARGGAFAPNAAGRLAELPRR